MITSASVAEKCILTFIWYYLSSTEIQVYQWHSYTTKQRKSSASVFTFCMWEKCVL